MAIQPVVLTTPGRAGNTTSQLSDTLAGHDDLLPTITHTDSQGLGAARATRDAIVAAGQGGHHVLFLEDDVEADPCAPCAVAGVASSGFPSDVAAVSFCDMREVAEFSAAGLYMRSALGSDGRGWWGNQALLLHPETVRMLSIRDWFAPEIEQSRGVRVHRATYDDGGRNCSDIRMALLIHHFGAGRSRYAVSVPSVFRHVGHTSMCFPGRSMGERSTRNWVADRRRFAVDETLAGEAINGL